VLRSIQRNKEKHGDKHHNPSQSLDRKVTQNGNVIWRRKCTGERLLKKKRLTAFKNTNIVSEQLSKCDVYLQKALINTNEERIVVTEPGSWTMSTTEEEEADVREEL